LETGPRVFKLSPPILILNFNIFMRKHVFFLTDYVECSYVLAHRQS